MDGRGAARSKSRGQDQGQTAAMALHHIFAENILLLVGEASLYFVAMVALLHLRGRIGALRFVAALGVMHFIETYLAAVFYIPLAFG